jgi:hypothetical protein
MKAKPSAVPASTTEELRPNRVPVAAPTPQCLGSRLSSLYACSALLFCCLSVLFPLSCQRLDESRFGDAQTHMHVTVIDDRAGGIGSS